MSFAELSEMVGAAIELPENHDLREFEAALGIRFPVDYIEWTESYPSVYINDFLYVHNMRTLPPLYERESAELTLTPVHEVTRLNGRAFVDGPNRPRMVDQPELPYFPASGGLLTWGVTDNGDFCMWKTAPEPENWYVVISDGVYWWECDLSFSGALAGLLSGRLNCTVFPSSFLSAPSTIQEFHQRLDSDGGIIEDWRSKRTWGRPMSS